MEIRNDIRRSLATKLDDAQLAIASERISRLFDEEIDKARLYSRRGGGGGGSGGGNWSPGHGSSRSPSHSKTFEYSACVTPGKENLRASAFIYGWIGIADSRLSTEISQEERRTNVFSRLSIRR
jgi:hypothetical protein